MSNREAGPEHECRQGRRCKARRRTPANEWQPAGVERPHTLCRSCEEAAFDAIHELFDDYCELATALTEERSHAIGPKVSGSSERSIPIPLAVDTLMSEIADETLRWALLLTRGEPVPPPSRQVGYCLRIICANLGTLVDTPMRRFWTLMPLPEGGDHLAQLELDGVDAVLRLARLHHRACDLLGMTETTTFLPDPCPHCARKALAVSKDQERVTCKGCQIVWDSTHFALLSNVLDFERKAVVA